jgi:hypothetical protein
VGYRAATFQPVAGCFHFFAVTKRQAKVLFVQFNLTDITFKLACNKVIPDPEILKMVLDFGLIRLQTHLLPPFISKNRYDYFT